MVLLLVQKFEIRSTKSETNSNYQNTNVQNINSKTQGAIVLNLEHSNFDIVSANLIKWASFDLPAIVRLSGLRRGGRVFGFMTPNGYLLSISRKFIGT
jgi:hypothetical protein